MVNRLSWCGVCLGCTWVVLAAEPQALRRMPLRIETQGTDPATRALMPGFVTALREGLKAEGIELEPTVDGAPVAEALLISVSTVWHPEFDGMEIHLGGQGGWIPESKNTPRSAQQTVLLRDRAALPMALHEHGLLLARYLVHGAGTERVESSSPVWVPTPASTIGLTPVEGSTMKLEGPRPFLEYPWLARSHRVQGLVSMDLRVDGKGNVAQVSMVDGHPLLADSALKYLFQCRFQVPSKWNGLGFLNFKASVKYGFPAISKVARAVVEIAKGDTTDRAIQPDLELIGKKVRELLSEEGVEVLAADDSTDPEVRRLRIEIETLCAPRNINLFGIRAQVSRFRETKPSGPGEVCQEGLVVGQQGLEGLHTSLFSTLEAVLRSVVEPPRPKLSDPFELPALRSALDTQEIDFSQLKVKHQPPAPRYPVAARERRIQGTVVVELEVGEDGRPSRGQVRKGPPELMLTALTYALDWTFEPVRINGVPMKCRFKLTMPFKLR